LSRDALLNQILDNPGDDRARLIFADWLEEHGDPRGEFIRLQCRLARPGGDRPVQRQMQRRANELVRTHRHEWLGDVDRGIRAGAVFERGFVTRWSLSVEQLVLAHDSIFRAAPLLETLELSGDAASQHPAILVAGVADAPQLRQLKGLWLRAAFRTSTLVALLGSPYLQNLHELRFWMMPGLNLRLLTHENKFPALQRLRIDRCTVADAGAQEIAGSRSLPALTTLELPGNNIGPAGVRAIIRAPRLARLTALGMQNNPCGDDGALALAATASATRFRWLNLAGTGITDASAYPLAYSPQLVHLRHFDLSRNPLISPGVRTLLQRRYASRLLI